MEPKKIDLIDAAYATAMATVTVVNPPAYWFCVQYEAEYEKSGQIARMWVAKTAGPENRPDRDKNGPILPFSKMGNREVLAGPFASRQEAEKLYEKFS